VEEALADYNGTSKRPMHLAMFLYALEHVSRISRLMKQPGGHMLLIGVGGSGRQSLAKLAAFMTGVELFQVREGVLSWQAGCQHAGSQGGFQEGKPASMCALT
jgi:Holliday junction resolvasome RuvABC ATP-dependent DNA helicase subunit